MWEWEILIRWILTKIQIIHHARRIVKKTNSEKKVVSVETVAITYFGGLFLALLITSVIYEVPIICAYLFPCGLVANFSSNENICFYSSYAIYLVMFIRAFTFRRKAFFKTLLAVYIIILCLTIKGCPAFVSSMEITIH
jgi:Sec-independent protein secretion pathway component TatC